MDSSPNLIPGDLIAAVEEAHKAGYRKMDAYSPYPMKGR